ncbi:MAG: hypothetical protein FWF25_00840 [Propionibacteriaceae bacterium]|nr:hypothetical protein [Propionibacteriaceae bacterium]
MSVAFSPVNPQFANVGGKSVGMDIEAVQGLGRYIGTTLTSAVHQAFNAASAQIPRIAWSGNDAKKFEQIWSDMLRSVAATMNSTFEALEQNINRQAQEQTTASAN